MSLLYLLAVIVLLPSCFAIALPDFMSLGKHAVEQQSGLENAVMNDFKYQLDLVQCPLAVPKNMSLITYQAPVYYSTRSASFYCCSQRLTSMPSQVLNLQEGKTLTIGTDGQIRGAIQYFKLSCSTTGEIVQDTFMVDLLPPVQYRGQKLCPDSVSFVFDNNHANTCQYCGNKVPVGGSSCGLGRFRELLVTFRSGFRRTNGHRGFNVTLTCRSAQSVQEQTVHRQQVSSCLEYDPRVISEQYLQNLQPVNFQTEVNDLEADLQFLLKKIPIDAKSTLLQLSDDKVSSSLSADRILRMLNLALLCEQSCDTELVALSKNVQALFPQETIVQAGLFTT